MQCRTLILAVLGAALILAGVTVYAYGYLTAYVPYESYENGAYTYVDHVSLFSLLFIFAGAAVLLSTFWLGPFRKWAREHGAIEG